MQPRTDGGVYLAGKNWSFISKASDDLDAAYELLSDIPRCDTKKEILEQIRKARGILNIMEYNVKQPGNAYTNGEDRE